MPRCHEPHERPKGNDLPRVEPWQRQDADSSQGGRLRAFERVLAEGLQRYAVELLTYSLMPNHWHLVARPKTDDALGRWMGWVGVTTSAATMSITTAAAGAPLPRAIQEFARSGG